MTSIVGAKRLRSIQTTFCLFLCLSKTSGFQTNGYDLFRRRSPLLLSSSDVRAAVKHRQRRRRTHNRITLPNLSLSRAVPLEATSNGGTTNNPIDNNSPYTREWQSEKVSLSTLLGTSEPTSTDENLLTDAQIERVSNLVQERSDARDRGDYERADTVRDEIYNLCTSNHQRSTDDGRTSESARILLPDGYKIEIRDIPRNQGGGSRWCVTRGALDALEWTPPDGGDGGDGAESVLQIAHAALGLAVSSSERGVPVRACKLDDLVNKAKARLVLTRGRELRGRKAADAAFWFALAGVTDRNTTPPSSTQETDFSLFDALTIICTDELRRFGKRSTCRSKDVMHIVERIAAAGITGGAVKDLQQLAAECLETKDDARYLKQNGVLDLLRDGKLEMHSDRPLLLLWRFATRQRKQRAFLKSAGLHWEQNDNTVTPLDGGTGHNEHKEVVSSTDTNWADIFDDPSLPLVIDLGCGMGVSLLGLSRFNGHSTTPENTTVHGVDWGECNFLGADLSALAINYATSVASRWNPRGAKRLHFLVESAENILEQVVGTYPGQAQLIMVQFPTPFRLQKGQDSARSSSGGDTCNDASVAQGNSQLPTDAFSGFMVTEKLLEKALEALTSCRGKLLVQSNCEDVAVLLKNIAIHNIGYVSAEVPYSVKQGQFRGTRVPKRTSEWISMGGERAEGKDWSAEPLIPKKGATETEVSCLLNGTPVHRCILSA